MHICFLCNEYPPGQHGGVGSFTQTLARALVDRGHKATVLGVYRAAKDSTEDDRGVQVVRLAHSPLPKTGFLINGFRLRQEMQNIHSRSPIDAIEGPELSMATVPASVPMPKIIRMSGGHHFFSVTLGGKPRKWRAWMERQSFQHADHLCAVSHFVAETTRKLLDLRHRPIEILPNPVDTAFFSPRPNIAEEDGLIVFVGTVCEKKGIRQLIQAMPVIVQAVPDAHLLAVGRDWRDPVTGASFMGSVRSQMPAGLESRVHFQGSVEHAVLPDVLAKASVCAYPSHMEAQGIVLIEGMAMGKAVVASSTGPGPEVIEHGSSGLLCDPYDPASIAEQIIRLMKDSNLRHRLGEQARRRAVEQFSVEVLVSRNEDFYRRCISKARANAA